MRTDFFDGIDVDSLRVEGKLSPKILIVKPRARLSWEYHHRRAEIWQVYKGEVGVIRSDDDTEGKLVRFSEGDQFRLAQGERHRLIGLEDYGIVAEICNIPIRYHLTKRILFECNMILKETNGKEKSNYSIRLLQPYS